MKLATWNINSIRARLERLTGWLDEHRPDVLCLQETKVEDEQFPIEAVESKGYHISQFGQRTYNGVAILSREPATDVERGFGMGTETDPQARLIAATFAGVRVYSVYAPNGFQVGSDKWVYKLQWLERLRELLATRHQAGEPVCVCGDFNVAPEPRDVYDPVAWEKETLFHPEARAALERLCGVGLHDSYRMHHQEEGKYTWWDYRQLSFPKNRGLRIDHILVSEALKSRCQSVEIDRNARKGKQPSDHAPVIAVFGGA